MTRNPKRALAVLDHLRSHANEWIPGYVLASKEIGGSEGLRRLRELRDDFGYPIERRRMQSSSAYEYRLPGTW